MATWIWIFSTTLLMIAFIGFTHGQGCYEEKLKNCFNDMAFALGIPTNQMSANIIFALVNPGVSNEVQNRTCSALKGFDYSSIKPCIISNGCNKTTVWTPEIARVVGLPVLTWMTLVDLLQSFCSPGCSSYERFPNETKKCGENIATNSNNDQCVVIKQTFQCYRNAVGQCEIVAVFTENTLDQIGLIDLAQQYCPGINVELYAQPSQTTTVSTVSSQSCNNVVWSPPSNHVILGNDDRALFSTDLETCKKHCIENTYLKNCVSIEHDGNKQDCKLSLKRKSDITDPSFIQPSNSYQYLEWNCNNAATTTTTTSTTTKPTTTTTTPTTTTTTTTTTPTTRTTTTTVPTTTTTTSTTIKPTTTTTTTTTTTAPTTTTTKATTTTTGGWITFSKPTTTTSTTTASTTTSQGTTKQTATTTTTPTQPTTTPTTTTTLPPEVTAHVQVKFNGSYTELIGNNKKAWETHAKPQIVDAAEVISDARIEKVKLSPGSIQLDFNILPSQQQGDIPVMVAVDNFHKKVENGQFVLQGPNTSSTIPYINHSFRYWNVTAEPKQPAPAKSNGIFAIGKVYIVLIALGILIVLLLITAIALILMHKRKDDRRSHGDGGELYDEEVDPPSTNGQAMSNGRKNDAADIDNVDTFNY